MPQSLTGSFASVSPLIFPSCMCCNRPCGANPTSPSVHDPFEASLRRILILKVRHVGDKRISRRSRVLVRASSNDENSDQLPSNLTTTSESEKDILAAKLAAAEAEAEVLKKELESRRAAGSKDGDLSKLKISTPAKRIDGTGYRERLFAPDKKKPEKKWGISEAELFLSKGAPTEGSGLGVKAMDDDAQALIKRRLGIGLGIAAAALALAVIKVPVLLNKPSKPLFFYLVYILRLKDQLESLENTASDVKYLESKLKGAIGSKEELKDNFLSAAALLEGADGDRAYQIAFDIFQYINQADYNKYFDTLGQPTGPQQVEFLRFSLQSIQAARSKIKEFLAFAPSDDLQAAKMQLPQ